MRKGVIYGHHKCSSVVKKIIVDLQSYYTEFAMSNVTVVSTVKRNLLLISSSTVYGHSYLEHAAQEIKSLLDQNNVREVLFIPYALKDYDSYLERVREPLKNLGFEVSSIHTSKNSIAAVNRAQAIFIGGGNTFRLLKSLYDNGLVEHIRKRVLQNGVPYIGSSAGTNVATTSIHTTNDMPIVYPPSFSALQLVPFNINPHYLDPDLNSTHQGETREERILQYHEESTTSVLALREGTLLRVQGNKADLRGLVPARLYQVNKEPVELPVGTDVSFLF